MVLAMDKEGGLHQSVTMLVPRSWTSQLPELVRNRYLLYISHPAHGILLYNLISLRHHKMCKHLLVSTKKILENIIQKSFKGFSNIKYVEWLWSFIRSAGQTIGFDVLWCYPEGSVKFYRRLVETPSLFCSFSSYWNTDVYVSHAKLIYELCSKVLNKVTSLNWWYSFKRLLHINHKFKTILII